mmetsp:Transcript_38015/g.151036  ORF Transcript_38015/g.151036 Transcript_38015/m.151036 type:complete len:515 (-) Transcript_38015:35-1579(-)
MEAGGGGGGDAPVRKRRRTRFSDAPVEGGGADASAQAMEGLKKVNEKLRPSTEKQGSSLSAGDRLAVLSARLGLALGKVPQSSQLKAPTQVDITSIPVKPVASLTVNQNRAREEKLKKTLKVEKADLLETDPTKNEYFDPRLGISVSSRNKRSFKFVEPGTYVEKGEKLREKAELDRLQDELRQKEKKSAKTPQALLLKSEQAEEIPAVEWWDVPFLKNGIYDDLEDVENLRLDRVTTFVHHPIPTRIPNEEPPPPIPLLLTQRERKKLRHQKRMEKEKDRQQQIQMGLIPPPAPKVKLSNMMRVLATQASQDPTKVEATIRKQVRERQDAHEARNEARKPSKDERAARQVEKVEKDKSSGLHACVFRVRDLRHPQHRFKININAEQNSLTGCAIYNDSCNIVVAEGGSKGLNKFKKLMLRRIDWSITADLDQEEEAAEGGKDNGIRQDTVQENRCVLVWEGQIPRQAFKRFMATPIPVQEDARKVFRIRRVEHYWDTALAFPMHDDSVGQREL